MRKQKPKLFQWSVYLLTLLGLIKKKKKLRGGLWGGGQENDSYNS